MLLENVFVQLSIVLVIATILSAIAKICKQPLIMAYILTGIIVSPSFLNMVGYESSVSVLSEIGVALLLFIVGISLSPKVIKEVGKVSLLTGVGQVITTTIIGYGLATLLGFNSISSIYIGIGLAFSSTIIVMKLLSDRGETEALYGKIAIGFLLVQDLIAVIALIIVTSTSDGGSLEVLAVDLLIKGSVLLVGLGIIGKYIIPKIDRFIASSQEFLYLFSIGWCMMLASLFHYFGFSIEIGALLAGVTLSMSPYHYEIASKIRPLRDFFIILFFIFLGSGMEFSSAMSQLPAAILLSLFVLIPGPFILMIITELLGYNKRTSYFTGIVTSQVSEFSLILLGLGYKVGHIGSDVMSLITMVAIITITASTYSAMYMDKTFQIFSGILSIFERKEHRELQKKKNKKYDVIMFGYDRVGYDIMRSLKKLKKKVLVIDYNPKTVSSLLSQGYICKYGDANDIELLNRLDFAHAKMIISTVPDYESNALILRRARQSRGRSIVICVAQYADDAIALYELGATYVITPHLIGGHHTAGMIKKFKMDYKKFSKEKSDHLLHLRRKRENN